MIYLQVGSPLVCESGVVIIELLKVVCLSSFNDKERLTYIYYGERDLAGILNPKDRRMLTILPP